MQKTINDSGARRITDSLLLPILLMLSTAATLTAQSFPSGSTGVDGNLNITAPGVTTFTQTPMGGGNIYNFGTITIAAGSTLRLSGQAFSGPLYFLAQGAVTIAGTLDLSGHSGAQVSMSAQVPSVPGQADTVEAPGHSRTMVHSLVSAPRAALSLVVVAAPT